MPDKERIGGLKCKAGGWDIGGRGSGKRGNKGKYGTRRWEMSIQRGTGRLRW